MFDNTTLHFPSANIVSVDVIKITYIFSYCKMGRNVVCELSRFIQIFYIGYEKIKLLTF